MKIQFKKETKCKKCEALNELLDVIPILKTSDPVYISNEASYFIPSTADVIFAWTERCQITVNCVKEQFVIYKTVGGKYIRCVRPMRKDYEKRYADIEIITEDTLNDIVIGVRNNVRNYNFCEILVDSVHTDYKEV